MKGHSLSFFPLSLKTHGWCLTKKNGVFMQILTGCSNAGISCLGTCLQYNLRNNNTIRRKVFYVHSIRTIKVTSFVAVDVDSDRAQILVRVGWTFVNSLNLFLKYSIFSFFSLLNYSGKVNLHFENAERYTVKNIFNIVFF